MKRTITLGKRSGGHYCDLRWHGDLEKPDADIVAECRMLLQTVDNVDNRDLTDDEIRGLIADARSIEKITPLEDAYLVAGMGTTRERTKALECLTEGKVSDEVHNAADELRSCVNSLSLKIRNKQSVVKGTQGSE